MPSYQAVTGRLKLTMVVEHSFSTKRGTAAQSTPVSVFPFTFVTRAIGFGYLGSGALKIRVGPAARSAAGAAGPFACRLVLAGSWAHGLPHSAYQPWLRSSKPLFLLHYLLDHRQREHFRCLRGWQLLGWPSGKASQKGRPCSCQTRCKVPLLWPGPCQERPLEPP